MKKITKCEDCGSEVIPYLDKHRSESNPDLVIYYESYSCERYDCDFKHTVVSIISEPELDLDNKLELEHDPRFFKFYKTVGWLMGGVLATMVFLVAFGGY